jgi:hyperosmotically inducible protein
MSRRPCGPPGLREVGALPEGTPHRFLESKDFAHASGEPLTTGQESVSEATSAEQIRGFSMKPIVSVITFAFAASTGDVLSADQAPGSDSGPAPTAQDQSNAPADLKLSQSIRRALVKDSSLSVSAKNVQVITSGGKVTLRGSVKSAEERDRIAHAAQTAAGADHVTNLLQVAAPR